MFFQRRLLPLSVETKPVVSLSAFGLLGKQAEQLLSSRAGRMCSQCAGLRREGWVRLSAAPLSAACAGGRQAGGDPAGDEDAQAEPAAGSSSLGQP